MQGQVTLFSKPNCKSCDVVYAELLKHHPNVVKRECADKLKLRALCGVDEATPMRAPVVFFNAAFVGDGEAMMEIFDAGGLEALMSQHLAGPIEEALAGADDWKRAMFA